MTYSCPPMIPCSNATLPDQTLAQMCKASTTVVFLFLLEKLIRSNDKISGKCERVNPIEDPDEEYDFVVIGGGGTGAVVGGRLSENPNWKVLLLEAGPDEPASSEVPLFSWNHVGAALDWNYTTVNESYACLGNNGTCTLSAAKMLGGGTSHNGMVYLRGNPIDYDNWAALGNEGWTWDEVKKFYLMSEDNGEIERVGRYYHATGGQLHIERLPYTRPFSYSFIAASIEAGYRVSEDLNGDNYTGFSIVQTTSKHGVRLSSASAYLRPARNRENLHVSLNSQVTKVLIENDKAIGVQYFQNGKPKTVRVSKEVVVSAGTIMSPHLLLNSGIGPREHLESVGIEVIKDLPGVGENFHTHVAHHLEYTINERDAYDNDWAIATEYLVNQTGPLSSVGLNAVVGILHTNLATPEFPDTQLYFKGYESVCAPGDIGALKSTGNRTVYLRVVNLHPKSRGRISLASSDPFEYPVIWGNLLSDPEDVQVLVEAIEAALVLADTEALRNHNLTLITQPNEGCSNYTFKTTEYWACAVRHFPEMIEFHFGGSCKMGPKSDPMAVVDPELRVYGIKGLRVADTSIMPQVISANTAAPAMMIGERAADFIKTHWNC